MRELYRQNNHLLKENHDLWILIKQKFTKPDSVEIEKIFIDSLLKINGI